MLVVLLLLVAETPVLLDPGAALAEASGHPLRAAEVAILGNDFASARAALKGAPDGPERLALETTVDRMAGDDARATVRRASVPSRWRSAILPSRPRNPLQGIGALLLAAALATAALGGSRELLRLRWETGALVVVGVFAFAIARLGASALASAVGMAALAVITLGHGLLATVSRTEPGPRARLMLLTVMGFGLVGLGLALVPAI